MKNSPSKREPGHLVYDEDCGFCSRSALWLDSNPVPWSSLDLAALGVTEAQADANAGWLAEDAITALGADAIAEALKAQHGPIRLLGYVIQAPIVHSVAKLVYRIVANNRHRMPGGSASCKLPTPKP